MILQAGFDYWDYSQGSLSSCFDFMDLAAGERAGVSLLEGDLLSSDCAFSDTASSFFQLSIVLDGFSVSGR